MRQTVSISNRASSFACDKVGDRGNDKTDAVLIPGSGRCIL
jgi:hypothetical protein